MSQYRLIAIFLLPNQRTQDAQLFLKNMKVYGFKTFAKKVTIQFQKGITAIVGPNGAGKTNLIDALNWVLGETRLKNMRVKSPTQLIFHGSPSLKPLSLAEVSITLENTDNRLPIDYSEVNIARRITKDGQGEFFINQGRCTLKDIHNLFVDTGVGKSAYSVMRQGEIDRILKQKPEERREIFEEAAGILKYRNRRRETERDLEKAEINLKQIRPTLVEVERQYLAKKKQAERAEKYRSLVEIKDQLEIDIHLIKIFDLKRQLAEKQEQQTGLQEKRQALVEQIHGLEQSIHDSLEESQKLQRTQSELNSRILQQEGQAFGLKQKITMLDERKQALESSINGWQHTIHQNSEKIAGINENIKELGKEGENYRAMVAELQDNLEKYALDIKEINRILEEDRSNIDEHQARIQALEAAMGQVRSDLESVINRLVEAIDKRKAELKGSTEQKQDLKTAIAHGLDEIHLFLGSKKDVLADLLQGDFVKHAKLDKVKQVLEGFRDGVMEKEHQVELLRSQFGRLDNLISGFDEIIFAREGIHARKEELDNQIRDMAREIKSHRERILFLETDITNQQGKIETIKEMMHESQLNLVQRREKLKSIEENIATEERFRRDVEARNEELQRNMEEARGTIQAIGEDIGAAKSDFDSSTSSQDQLKEELSRISKDLSSIYTLSSTREKKAGGLKEDLEKLHRRIDDLNRDITGFEVEIRTIYDNFYENYSIDLRTHEQTMANKRFDMAQLRTELKKTREEIKALGQINSLAIEECRELEERYNLLREQIEDIEKSKSDLETIIREINKNSEEIFLQTFNRIKVNFHKIFRRLFDGGKAELNLTNPENVLESGIEIMVQPPAKALQSVSLLSGGEMSMTAIALLFAIFMVRPSPFCLLDEIDAALDGPNIGRFKKLLLEFRDTTQFLMISHNINTLKVADALYGISMEEDGVSTAVSVNIGELEKNKKKYMVQ